MAQVIVFTVAVLMAGAGIVYWLNMTAEWAERDQLRQFHEAMRRAGHPHPDQREE